MLRGDEDEILLQKEGDAATVKTTIRSLLLLLVLSAPMFACDLSAKNGPPSNAVVLDVIANSALEPWLEDAVEAFNDQKVKTEDRSESTFN